MEINIIVTIVIELLIAYAIYEIKSIQQNDFLRVICNEVANRKKELSFGFNDIAEHVSSTVRGDTNIVSGHLPTDGVHSIDSELNSIFISPLQ